VSFPPGSGWGGRIQKEPMRLDEAPAMPEKGHDKARWVHPISKTAYI